MKEIPLPMSEEAREKKAKSLKRMCTFVSVLTVACAVCAVLLLLGVFIAVIVAEFKFDSATLCYILAGAFAGAAVLFALAAAGLGCLSRRADDATLDFLERCDGEESFFVGEGTLATFQPDRLCIHGSDPRVKVFIPYAEIRAFSVCTRTAPRERGEWSVVFEMPARYLSKDKSPKNDPALVQIQADDKERLRSALRGHGIPLSGERREEAQQKGRFRLAKRFVIPNRKKRSRAFLVLGVGIAAFVAGIPVALCADVTIGAILAVFGVLFAGRSLFDFMRAKGEFSFYEEGLFWKDPDGIDRLFLKWSEIEAVTRGGEGSEWSVQCAYGTYHLPDVAGAYEYLAQFRPEKCADRAMAEEG